MPLGNILEGTDAQYVANNDDNGTWRILNSWHEDLKLITADDEILDDSDAVTVLSEGQFIALIKEAARLGVLQNASFETGDAELEAEMLDKDQEIQRLHQEILQLKEEKSKVVRNSAHSEDYELKEQAMDSILKLVGMQEMANLSRD